MIRLQHEDPPHECPECRPDGAVPFGALPWHKDDGGWDETTCPWPDLGDALGMLALHREWERGIHPVSTGRVSWLTDGFYMVMRTIDGAAGEQRAIEAERRAASMRR